MIPDVEILLNDVKDDAEEVRFDLMGDTLTITLKGVKELHKEKKDWPQKGDEYWIVDRSRPRNYGWNNDAIDSDQMSIGNVYRTKEEAEANRDKWVAFYASDKVLKV